MAEASATDADIVVTAQRREQKLQDVPIAITALGSNLFTENGVGKSANEIFAYVPNASAGTVQHGRPRWWIRGVGAGQQQLDLSNPVGFYLDDVYISNASATGVPLFDLERVEVLRGPQGTLWGKNTTGGAINVISRKPTFSPGGTDNYFKLDYGTYADKTMEGGVGAVLAPWLAGRISFHAEDRNGRFDNTFTGDKDNHIFDGLFRGQLLARPTDNFEALLSVHYRRYNTDGITTSTASYASTGILRNGFAPPTGWNTVDTNAPDYTGNKQYGGSLHLNWDLGPVAVTAITGYERFETHGPSDNDYTPLEISRGYMHGTSNQWTQELRIASPQHNRFNWIAGLYYFNERINSGTFSARLPDGTVAALPGSTAPVAYSATFYRHKAESGAAFGSGTYDFTDALKLTLGARFTRETKTLDFNRLASASAASASWSDYTHWWDSYTGTYGGAGTFSDNLKKTWDAFTYDVTPNWKIDRHNLIYVKFSHGLKSGGFNTAAALPAALLTVKPETLNSYEFGYKSTWFNGKLTFNATAFHYDYRNVQINVVGPNPGAVGGTTVSYLQNASRGHADGAEIEIDARPIENLHLTESTGILYTRYDKLQVINGGANLSGAQFVRAPHLTLNGSASYTIPLHEKGSIELEADARYTSLQYYFVTPQDTTNRPLLDQPAYTLANARISYTTHGDRLTLSAYVVNFLDKHYLNHSLPLGGTAAVTGDAVYRGDPRTWGGSVIYRF